MQEQPHKKKKKNSHHIYICNLYIDSYQQRYIHEYYKERAEEEPSSSGTWTWRKRSLKPEVLERTIFFRVHSNAPLLLIDGCGYPFIVDSFTATITRVGSPSTAISLTELDSEFRNRCSHLPLRSVQRLRGLQLNQRFFKRKIIPRTSIQCAFKSLTFKVEVLDLHSIFNALNSL